MKALLQEAEPLSFQSGRIYTVKKLSLHHPLWDQVRAAIARRTRSPAGELGLIELYSVRWREKPFPWSWSREFKPQRRFFYHGTTRTAIQQILDQGFKVAPARRARHGHLLGPGVYATYHTDKGRRYGSDDYVLSVMVYAPDILVVHPGGAIDLSAIQQAPQRYDAIEVRTGAVVRGRTIQHHEICVFDPRRVVPRFIVKIG